jgi:Bacterial toxin 23
LYNLYQIKYLSIILLFWQIPLQAQDVTIGGKVGVIIQYGTHVQKIGFMAGGYLGYYNAQINSHVLVNKCFKNIGPSGKFLELQFRNTVLLGFEKATANYDTLSFFNSLTYLQQYNMHIAYAFNMYKDNRGTNQNTGTIKMGYKHLAISTENDAFAFSAWDRFRTGSITISFNNKYFYVANNYILFTGQANLQPTIIDTNYNSKYGYVNMREAKFGASSNGIAQLNFGVSLPYYQNINASIGIDDERVRHFFQNKLIHDNILIHALNPKAHNPHIPMLATDGKAFLKKNKQLLKPLKWLGALGVNALEVY